MSLVERPDLYEAVQIMRIGLGFRTLPNEFELRFPRPYNDGQSWYPCHFTLAKIEKTTTLHLSAAPVPTPEKNVQQEFIVRGGHTSATSDHLLTVWIQLLPESSLLVPPTRFQMEYDVPKQFAASRGWRAFIDDDVEHYRPRDVKLEEGLVWNKDGNLLLFFEGQYWQQW